MIYPAVTQWVQVKEAKDHEIFGHKVGKFYEFAIVMNGLHAKYSYKFSDIVPVEFEYDSKRHDEEEDGEFFVNGWPSWFPIFGKKRVIWKVLPIREKTNK